MAATIAPAFILDEVIVRIVWIQFVAACFRFTTVVFAGVPFEGDREVVEILRAAQQANMEMYPAGQLKASVVQETPSQERQVNADVVMEWNGDSTYWEYGTVFSHKGQSHSQVGVRRIESPSSRLTFLISESRLISCPTKHDTLPEYLILRPKDVWFSFVAGRTWLEMLDPDFGDGYVESVRVHRKDRGEVLFERRYKAGNSLTVTCSLKLGGNVIRYETTPVTDKSVSSPSSYNPIQRGIYTWVSDGRNGFRLEALEKSESDAASPNVFLTKRAIRILEFDTGFVPPPERFTLTSLGIKPGILVDEYSPAHRSYVYGVRPTATVQEELDAMLRRLPQAGFPSASRGK